MERITLRLPEDLHAQLKQLAKSLDRSLNAQIIHCLRTCVGNQAEQAITPTSRRLPEDKQGKT